MKRLLLDNVLIFVSYCIVSLLTFFKLPLTFFQQDEWAILGYHMYWDKANLNWFDRLFTYELYTHYTPISNYFSYLQGKIFSIQFPPYAYTSIVFQAVNSFLVYYLALLLIRNKKLAFLSGLLFLTSYITHQAITWTATTMGTAGATTFVLISLIFFTRYMLYDTKIRNVLFSSFFLFLSLGFKETSLFVFLFIPVFYCIYTKKFKLRKLILTVVPFVFLGILYVLLRYILISINAVTTQVPVALYQPSFLVYIYRIFTLPLKAIAQSFIPMNALLSVSDLIIRLGYPSFVRENNVDPYISQSVGADLISFGISFLILCFSFFLIRKYYRMREKYMAKAIISSLFFISLSIFPLIFIPGIAGYFSLFDGRHLYMGSIFTSILLSVGIWGIYKTIRFQGIKNILLIFIITTIIVWNALGIRKDINSQVGVAFTRKSILEKIYIKYPVLPKKVIFFVESDTAYYGLAPEEKILPFQSGFGQTLLVWYNEHGQKFPACFFKGEYLYVIESEGYKECEGRGFGYFRKKENLKKAVKEYSLSLDTIVSFHYNSSQNALFKIEIKTLIQD